MPPASASKDPKQLARRPLERHPVLMRNRLYHEVQKRRAYHQICVRPELASRPDLVHELDERGIAIIPDYLDGDTTEAMLAATERPIEAARRGELDDAYTVQPDIVIRIGRVTRRFPRRGRFRGPDDRRRDARVHGPLDRLLPPRAGMPIRPI